MWQIQKSLGLIAETGSPPVNFSIGNDNRTKGDVLISNVEIDVSYDRYVRSAQLWENVVRLRVSLESFLKRRRVALVLVGTHEWTADQVKNFADMLWNGALEILINRGLLVIDIFDHERTVEPSNGWPPDPHCILNLPEYYEGQSRVDAFNDLASLAMSWGWHQTSSEAEIFAGAILDASSDIRDVYAMLARTRGRRLGPGANA